MSDRIKPGDEVVYTPMSGPVVVLTVEKVLDDDAIDGVIPGHPRTHTPRRFSNLKHDASGALNTWRFDSELGYERLAVTAPAGEAQWQRRWRPQQGGK